MFFTGCPGVKLDTLNGRSSPRDVFDAFFTQDLWDLMVKETNLYALQQGTQSSRKKWVDLEVSDLQKYIGLRIYMGYLVLPSFRDYWAVYPIDGGVVAPRHVMSRDKFELIRSHLHFTDNEDARAKTDRYWKIRPVLDILDERFRTVYVPSQKVCIDESLLLYRGRHSGVQFIPSKRARYGLKVFKLCESDGPCTGYTSVFNVYLGDKKDKGKPKDQFISYRTVVTLLDRAEVLDKGYTVYMDNWFSSPTLYHDLQARKTSAVGTVGPNRKYMPNFTVKKKGELEFASSPLGMLAIRWVDKKKVNLLSTIHKAPDLKEVPCGEPGKFKSKPQIVLDYNLGKTGVDVSDQMASYYNIRRKSVKWYQTLFWHLVDMVICNSFLVWRHLGGPDRNHAKQLQFRKDLIYAWLGFSDWHDSPRKQPLRLPGPFSRLCLLEETKKKRKCKWCYHFWLMRRDTKFWCRQCQVFLCPGHCFNEYHKGEFSSGEDE